MAKSRSEIQETISDYETWRGSFNLKAEGLDTFLSLCEREELLIAILEGEKDLESIREMAKEMKERKW